MWITTHMVSSGRPRQHMIMSVVNVFTSMRQPLLKLGQRLPKNQRERLRQLWLGMSFVWYTEIVRKKWRACITFDKDIMIFRTKLDYVCVLLIFFCEIRAFHLPRSLRNVWTLGVIDISWRYGANNHQYDLGILVFVSKKKLCVWSLKRQFSVQNLVIK